MLSQTFEGFIDLAESLPLPDGGHGPPVQDSPHPLAGPAGPHQALGLPPALLMLHHQVVEVVRGPRAVVRQLGHAPAAGHLELDRLLTCGHGEPPAGLTGAHVTLEQQPAHY